MELRELKGMSKYEFGKWIATAEIAELKEIAKNESYIVSKLKKADLVKLICDLVEENVITIDVEQKVDYQYKLIKSFQGFKKILGGVESSVLEITDQAIRETLGKLTSNSKKIDKLIVEQDIINDLNVKLDGTGFSVKREIYVSNDGDISEETFLCGRDVFRSIYQLDWLELMWIEKGIIPNWWDTYEFKEDYNDNIFYIVEENRNIILNSSIEDITDFKKSIIEIKIDLLDKVNIDQSSTDYFDMDTENDKIYYAMDTLDFIKMCNGTYKENRTTVKLLEKCKEQFVDAIYYVENL